MPNDKEFELDDLESFSFDDLSLDDAPSSDAPSESASGEDPFGVWVKSAPEDVGPGEESEPLPDSEGLAEDDFLSSEELANLDDSFDFVTVSEQPLEGETPLEDEIAFLDAPEAVEAEKAAPEAAGGFDEVSLDDFVSFEDVALDETPAFVTESLADAANAAAEDDQNEEFLDIDIDIEDDIGDEELEIIEGAAQRAPEPESAPTDSFAAQEVDLSEFGDFEEVTPVSDGPLAGAEDLPEVMDLPDMPSLDEIELPEEESFEETVLEDALPPLVDEGPVSLDLEPDDQTDLDHIMALEEDLTSGIRTDAVPAASPAPAAAPAPSDMAALILGKIEQELSSIKQEISALKQEVTHMRAAPAPEPVFAAPEAPEAPAKPHGFFDEEDDETIALTGDELDNILSTAEISEGEEAGLSLDEDLLGMDDEGNLLDLPSSGPAPELSAEDLHVTDEEFLAGTALDLNEPDPLEDEISLGIPDSIELEDGLPLELEEGQTEDLLASGEIEEELEITPLPEGLLSGSPAPLEIPFDDDIDLDLESAPLAPELGEEAPQAVIEESLDPLPGLEDLPALADAEGWSPSGSDSPSPALEEEDLLPALDAVAPPPVPAAPAGGPLSSGMKSELKAVLQYMDKLLASLPDDKIQEFAESEHFEVYKRLFEELGLIE